MSQVRGGNVFPMQCFWSTAKCPQPSRSGSAVENSQAVDPRPAGAKPSTQVGRAGGSWLRRDRKPDRLVRKYDQSDCRPDMSDPKKVVGVRCVQMVSEARVLPNQTCERKIRNSDLRVLSLKCCQQPAIAPITVKQFTNHWK